jgi:L-asparaginase/Glu-tRNA(Gln) amidotransferase subunit D
MGPSGPIHKLLLMTTGGTIAGQVATAKQHDGMIRTTEQFSQLIAPTISYLNSKRRIQLEVEVCGICDLDSSDILPQHWAEIAELIKRKYDDYH